MDDRGRRCVADRRGDILGLPNISLERGDVLSEERREVPADEPVGAGDEDAAYRTSVAPRASRRSFSSSERRWARIRFWSASFEITVE
jgi:hypothetical protein